MELKSLIDSAQKLPNIPRVVQELIESLNDEQVNIAVIAAKISADQVLTAKLLRAANSAHYGSSRQIGSVNSAVMLLGFNSVRTLVLAAGITSAFKPPENFDLKGFWHHSFAVAETCRWLAGFSKDSAETAFVCGMMHSIGELLIHILLPQECRELQRILVRGGPNSEVEKSLLGFNFVEAGAELAGRWKFPEVIVAALAYQLNPAAAPEFSRFAALVHLASFIVQKNESSQVLVLAEGFPDVLAVKLGINLTELMAAIDESAELAGRFDYLLG